MLIIRKLIWALLVFVTFFASQTTVTGAPGFGQTYPSLSGLRIGDSVRVDYMTSGCFHFFHAKFTIDGRAPLAATITRFIPNWEAPDDLVSKPVVLTAENLQAMDQALNFYRSHPDGGCTTAEIVKITWRMRDQWIYSESLVTRSCTGPSLADTLGKLGVWLW